MTECFGIVFLAMFLGSLGWLAMRIPRPVNHDRAVKSIKAVAERIRGKANGLALEFERRGFPARATLDPGSTEVTFRIDGGVAEALSISSESTMSELTRQLGFGDLNIGDEAFDKAFIIQTPERSVALKVLTPDMKRILTELGRRHRLLFRMAPHTVTIRVYEHLYNWGDLESFIGVAMQIFDLVDLAPKGEVVVIDTVTGPAEEDAKCEICGGLLSNGLVVKCAKCNTPHHKDCWTFNGLCATFACGGKTFNG